MVTLALSLFVGSAMLVAFMVTSAGLGTWAGAVYRPEEEIVPTVAVPPATLFTSQVTPLLLVLVTVAVNCWVWETESETAGGSTETATSELAIVGCSASLPPHPTGKMQKHVARASRPAAETSYNAPF